MAQQKPPDTSEGERQTRKILAAQEAGEAARKATTPTGPSKVAAIQRDTTSLADLAARSKPLVSKPIQSAKPLGLARGASRRMSRE